MQIIERVTPAELRTWKRWVNTLESMLWLVQTAPMRAQSARRDINAEDRSLLVYLNGLISQGRQLTSEPVFNWQMQSFEDEYRCAVSWFHALHRQRHPDWKV